MENSILSSENERKSVEGEVTWNGQELSVEPVSRSDIHLANLCRGLTVKKKNFVSQGKAVAIYTKKEKTG